MVNLQQIEFPWAFSLASKYKLICYFNYSQPVRPPCVSSMPSDTILILNSSENRRLKCRFSVQDAGFIRFIALDRRRKVVRFRVRDDGQVWDPNRDGWNNNVVRSAAAWAHDTAAWQENWVLEEVKRMPVADT